MPQRTDHTAINFQATAVTLQDAAWGIGNIAALSNRRMHAELELLGHRNFHLRIFPCRAKDADPFDPAFRSHNRELLLARILARLREISMPGKLVAFAEKRLDVLLREMDMMS